MSTKIGIISEGPIDNILLPALLERIAADKAGFTWPLDATDVAQHFPLRKRGHGGVLETVRALITALDTQHFDHACFVIVLDRKTEEVRKAIAHLILGRDRFVLGVAIEEIEAWWLGDRPNTFAWTNLRPNTLPEGIQYARDDYKAEEDPRPKKTLDKLTCISDRFDRSYGEGNADMAADFADRFWKRGANLDAIAVQCPRGFGRFQKAMANAFRRAKARSSSRA